MKVQLLMFDLDGTLIDSKPDIVIAVNRALAERKYPTFSEDAVGKCIGYGIHFLFQKLMGPELDGEPLDLLVETYRKYYQASMSAHSKVYPGIIESLEHFQDIPRVVLTNKNQKFADQILRELKIHSLFAAVYGGDAFHKQKPDPLPIFEICKTFQVQPENAVMIGDSEVDLAAAKSAGARSVIVRYGYGNPQAIAELKPDHQIDSAFELQRLFTR